MELTLLGTGCPAVSTERYGPAQVICHQNQAILVDCGSGVTQRLLAAGLSGRALDAVFLTHLHSDHIVDLFQLVISSWHQGRDRPQRIFGPRGTKAYVAGLLALWQPELAQRIAHERRPSTRALEVQVEEFDDGASFQFGELQVTAVEVDHKPVNIVREGSFVGFLRLFAMRVAKMAQILERDDAFFEPGHIGLVVAFGRQQMSV